MEERAVVRRRIPALDLIRAVAILTVILVHTVARVYDLSVEGVAAESWLIRCVSLGILAVGRLGVPLFLFLTGYLLLDREYDRERTLRFWKDKTLGLLITAEIWIVLYFLLYLALSSAPRTGWDLLEQMLFLRSSSANHLWYMGQILGIYLVLPLVAQLLHRVDFDLLIPPLLVSVCFCFLPSTLNVFRTAMGLDPLSGRVFADWSGGIYGAMVLLGWMTRRGCFRRIKSWVLVLGAVGGLAACLGAELFGYSGGMEATAWYDWIFVPLAALCLFNLLLRVKRVPFPRAVTSLSRYSFGIYLIHNAFNMQLSYHLPIGSRFLRGTAAFLLTLALSWGSVCLLSRNRALGRVLFRLQPEGKGRRLRER